MRDGKKIMCGCILTLILVMVLSFSAFAGTPLVKDASGGYQFMQPDGSIAVGQWCQYKDKWYYAGSDGYLLKEQWLQDGGEWYYFDADRSMHTGGRIVAGVRYYFDSSGKMLYNTTVTEDGTTYEIGSDGVVTYITYKNGKRKFADTRKKLYYEYLKDEEWLPDSLISTDPVSWVNMIRSYNRVPEMVRDEKLDQLAEYIHKKQRMDVSLEIVASLASEQGIQFSHIGFIQSIYREQCGFAKDCKKDGIKDFILNGLTTHIGVYQFDDIFDGPNCLIVMASY